MGGKKVIGEGGGQTVTGAEGARLEQKENRSGMMLGMKGVVAG